MAANYCNGHFVPVKFQRIPNPLEPPRPDVSALKLKVGQQQQQHLMDRKCSNYFRGSVGLKKILRECRMILGDSASFVDKSIQTEPIAEQISADSRMDDEKAEVLESAKSESSADQKVCWPNPCLDFGVLADAIIECAVEELELAQLSERRVRMVEEIDSLSRNEFVGELLRRKRKDLAEETLVEVLVCDQMESSAEVVVVKQPEPPRVSEQSCLTLFRQALDSLTTKYCGK